MTTVPFNMSLHYLIAMKWFRTIKRQRYNTSAGGAPQFSSPDNLDSYLIALSTVVMTDNTFNGRSRYAEKFAICLHQSGNRKYALHLFQMIVGDKNNILYLKKRPSPYVSDAVANRPGKLGYEGLYRFALLALGNRREKLAKKLFLEIVEKTPTECFPIRLQDIRVESLKHLRKLEVTKLASGRSVADEYKAADAHQY